MLYFILFCFTYQFIRVGVNYTHNFQFPCNVHNNVVNKHDDRVTWMNHVVIVKRAEMCVL